MNIMTLITRPKLKMLYPYRVERRQRWSHDETVCWSHKQAPR